jgi:hypothetical protein
VLTLNIICVIVLSRWQRARNVGARSADQIVVNPLILAAPLGSPPTSRACTTWPDYRRGCGCWRRGHADCFDVRRRGLLTLRCKTWGSGGVGFHAAPDCSANLVYGACKLLAETAPLPRT